MARDAGTQPAESCDVYYYDMAQKVGIDKIAEMGRKLGLGVRHDCRCRPSPSGNMPDKAWKLERYKQEWRIGDTINASIGQGYVLASPLQLAVMTARIASGRAVSRGWCGWSTGKEVPLVEAPALDIPLEHLRRGARGMNAVVNGETAPAKSSRIVDPTMVMAGKTGTSQVRNISAAERESGVVGTTTCPGTGATMRCSWASRPFDAPRYAVAVVVEHGGGGSTAAAPIARDVILRALSAGCRRWTPIPKASAAGSRPC
jgi:penicillin-binding protein 2